MKRESIGAAWLREYKSKNGVEKYYSIKIGDELYVAFKNTYKDKTKKEDEKKPDLIIYRKDESEKNQDFKNDLE